MADIKTVAGRPVIDYMARDYDSLLQAMRNRIPELLPEWTDYESEADFGNVLLQLFAHMGDLLSYYQDRIANESFLGTAQSRRSIIHHLGLIGYRLATAAPASATLSLLIPRSHTGKILVKQGDAFATRSQHDRASVRFEYTGETLTLDPKNPQQLETTRDPATGQEFLCFGPDPYASPSGQTSAGLPVEEGRTIFHELVGFSDGTPNQRYTLAHPRVIVRWLGTAQGVSKDIDLRLIYAGKEEPWTVQETLAFSREKTTEALLEGLNDYTLEIDEYDRATVVFGDGTFGRVPPPGAEIKATYRVGGGIQGNVARGSIDTLVDSADLAVVGALLTNTRAAVGGAERESTEHAVRQAPGVFRSLRRAVTADDFRNLALNCPGVGKVRAEAGDAWNTVILYVAPEGGGYLSDLLRANLLAYFEDKRPLLTQIVIEDVDYVPIYVRARLGVKAYYRPEQVMGQVRERAGILLEFGSLDFGQPIFLSKFYEAIESVEGVDHVVITHFMRDVPPTDTPGPSGETGERVEPRGKITLEPGQLACIPDDPAFAGGIQVLPEEESARGSR